MSYTTSQERVLTGQPATIAIDTSGGGSVDIQVKINDTYRTMKTVSENDIVEITGRGIEFRVNVTGSVEYEIY